MNRPKHISTGSLINVLLHKHNPPPEDDFPRIMCVPSRQNFASVEKRLFLLFVLSLLVTYDRCLKHETTILNSEGTKIHLDENL